MGAQNDVRVTFRVDKDLKERAEYLFEYLGMNMSTALNIFLRKTVDEESIPFVIGSKKPVFGTGYLSTDVTEAFSKTVDTEIAEKQQKGYPIAKYDTVNKQAYLEVADGTREYVNG